MGLHALGDSAWLFKASGPSPENKLELILRLRQILELNPIPEIVDLVSSFDTIAVYFNPIDGETVLNHLTCLQLGEANDQQDSKNRTVTIPVVYGGEYGPDLQALAKTKNLSATDLIYLHKNSKYTVAAIGFSPGFPYLQGLPPELHQARHRSPKKVSAGSIAIAGDQAGIYPFASHGGWHVIGRTDVNLFNPENKNPSLLQPGDTVQFVETEKLETTQLSPSKSKQLDLGIQILEPGALSSVQDHGRWGRQHLGISPGGAVDPLLATIANRLVGNSDGTAVIECNMTGPVLKFNVDATISWVGWANEGSGKPHRIPAGSEIDLRGRMSHLRGYIAVAGGIDVPETLGSCATDLRAVLGGHHGRTLRAGDTLPVGKESSRPISNKWHVTWPQPSGKIIELRFLRGIQGDWFTDEAHRKFTRDFYEISASFDRTATQLTGSKLKLKQPREMVSQPVVVGSIQVPPEGEPIVLMSERQTIGGYPQIGHLISADIPNLARAWPGTKIQFREVELEEARDAWNELQRDLGFLNAGLMTAL
ncbi:MAG: 5-oxoprolinase subunit PxpB [Akkermansiaceae bacterium]